jgi:hypothetical protein
MSADSNDWTAVTVSSRKGFGPLASRSTRLAQKLSYTGPGPGEYDELTAWTATTALISVGSTMYLVLCFE